MKKAAFDTRLAGGRGALRSNRAVILFVIGAILVILVVPSVVNGYWLFLLMTGLISCMVLQSLGILVGRLGALALCQMTFMGTGAWVAQWASVNDVPGGFFVWIGLGALGAVPLGLVVGATALRLRGAMLAVATFALATTSTIVWSSSQFPGEGQGAFMARPLWLSSDSAYFGFLVVVLCLIFGVLRIVDQSKLGSSWTEIRYSERAAAAHGINVSIGKLIAFMMSAFTAGLAGALLAGQQGSVNGENFNASMSVAVFALAIMLGVHHPEAAILGGIMYVLFPVILQLIGIPQDVAAFVFAVLAFFVLKGSGGTMGYHDILRARSRARRAAKTALHERDIQKKYDPELDAATAAMQQLKITEETPVALDVRNLTVNFGSVTAINDVTLSLRRGEIVGLIGPNGAGKSSLINAISGFVESVGSIETSRGSLNAISPQKRARHMGVRRSFQHLQVAPDLTVEMYIRSVAGRKLGATELSAYLTWFGCPPADRYIDSVDLGSRRILEVAGLAASGADVLLLDEPAAGQGAEESRRLGEAIQEIPARTGSAVLLVEHDMALVRETCSRLVILTSGSVLAAGPPDAVLSRPDVIEAYLGHGPEASSHNQAELKETT